MPGLHEVSGIELIERVSKEFLAKEENSSRVWSPSLECWGFFDRNPSDHDKLIIIGCAKNGDLILPDRSMIWKPLNDGSWEPYHSLPQMSLGFGMVIDKRIIEIGGTSNVSLCFLLGGSTPGVFNILIKQHDVYNIMWNMI